MNPTDKPTPTVEDLDDARTLVWDMLDKAAARLAETASFADRARDLAEIDRRLDRWAELATGMAVDARAELLRLVLATAPDFERRRTHRPEKLQWPNRGVSIGDKVYVAAIDPYQEDDQGVDQRPGGPDRMQLHVLDRAALLDATVGVDLGVVSPRAR